MSMYTPCFPPTDGSPSGQRRLTSSNSSATSISGSHAVPDVPYSVRLSRSHLALASVSEYIPRSPSPSSAAIDSKRVNHLRRKFRLAVDAAYRDTSSGKWAHVSELAKLGSTRGRWQGMCSGSSTSPSPYKAHEQNHQGLVAESTDHPRPSDLGLETLEVRERVENWQAGILTTLSQPDNQESEPNQLIYIGNAKQQSLPNFPVAKQQKRGATKAAKHKNKLPYKHQSTSRYFRDVADPKFLDGDGVNRDTEGVTTSPSEPHGSSVSNAGPTPHTRTKTLHKDLETLQRCSQTPVAAADPENIQQVSELFLPPSFPSHLQTSTPPPLPATKCTHFRLTKPPEIPQSEDPYFSAQLLSPPPFPPSQAVNRNLGSDSNSHGSPSSLRHKRPLQDAGSLAGSPNRLSKPRLWSSSSEKSTPPKPHCLQSHTDVRRCDLDMSPTFASPVHIPVIDLRQLASSQRSRTQSRHSSHVINPITPTTKERVKSSAMTADIPPSQ